MIKKTLTRGFTLIELLVVIAIIGILASVVLASLNTARAKGVDAAVRSDLNNMRAQAAIVYDNMGSYDTVCEDSIVAQAVATAGASCADGSDNTGTFAFAVNLVVTVGNSYCVDSSGAAKDATVAATTEVADGVCNGS